MFEGDETAQRSAATAGGFRVHPGRPGVVAHLPLPRGPDMSRGPDMPRGPDMARPAAGPTETAVLRRGDGSDPERQLWCAVIIHTLYEAAGRVAYAERGEHAEVRQAAIAWFEEADEDFQAVCDLAGFLPAAIRESALRVIRGRRLPRMRISKAG